MVLHQNTNKTFVTERGGFRYQNAKAIKDTHFPQSGSLPVYSLLEYSSNIGMTKLVAPHFEHNPDSYRLRVGKLGLLTVSVQALPESNQRSIQDWPTTGRPYRDVAYDIRIHYTDCAPIHMCLIQCHCQ